MLGASPEQIDRERERVRADLFGDIADEPRNGPATGNGLTAPAPNAGTPPREDVLRVGDGAAGLPAHRADN